MPPKHKKTIQKLTNAVKECHISSTETPAASGTSISSSIDPTLLSKWPKLKPKIPDVFLHRPACFFPHINKVDSLGIEIIESRLCRYYTKITCQTMNDHKALVQYFEKRQLPFHTFGIPSKRKMKVVIRGLPKDIDLNMLKSTLKSLAIPIVRVHKMKRHENVRVTNSLLLIVVPFNDEGKRLLQVQKIMGYNVTLEPAKSKTRQCHRCQMWGHTQRYCRGQMKCVKCAGDHITKKCTRDPKQEPPKCANCSGEHTANYKKCPCCPDSVDHKESQILKRRGAKIVNPKLSDRVALEDCDSLFKSLLE